VHHYYENLSSPLQFFAHLLITYTLTFCIFSSLIVCVARDPGPVGFDQAIAHDEANEDRGDEENMSLAQALMAPPEDEDFNSPSKWCRTCWAPKPERTHHCSHCGRCVLKMGTPERFVSCAPG
jgi:palmitoyltransferase ZDHHC2/15/20